MRIVIEINGSQPTVTAPPPGAAGPPLSVPPPAGAAASPGGGGADAAGGTGATRAFDAGPGPSMGAVAPSVASLALAAPGAPVPFQATGPSAPAAGSEGQDAGPAPDTLPDMGGGQ